MTALALLATTIAFALLGLSSDRRHRPWRRIDAGERGRRPMRAAAWSVLAIAFVLCVLARGWTFGPIVWCGLVMLGAGIAFLILNLVVPTVIPPSPLERSRT